MARALKLSTFNVDGHIYQTVVSKSVFLLHVKKKKRTEFYIKGISGIIGSQNARCKILLGPTWPLHHAI